MDRQREGRTHKLLRVRRDYFPINLFTGANGVFLNEDILPLWQLRVFVEIIFVKF